jgi:hypothetical protein
MPNQKRAKRQKTDENNNYNFAEIHNFLRIAHSIKYENIMDQDIYSCLKTNA